MIGWVFTRGLAFAEGVRGTQRSIVTPPFYITYRIKRSTGSVKMEYRVQFEGVCEFLLRVITCECLSSSSISTYGSPIYVNAFRPP